MNNLNHYVRHLLEVRAVHRSGVVLADADFETMIRHLRDEVDELADAENDANAREELADVMGIVAHLAIKLGVSPQELEQAAMSKIEMRVTIPGMEGMVFQPWRAQPWAKNRVCSKCGVTVSVNRQKYCGDGSDKDNEHRWVDVAQPKA